MSVVGSNSILVLRNGHVRFAPDSDRTTDIPEQPLRAINRMYQLSALPPDPYPRIAIAGFTRKSYSLGATRSCCSHIGGVSPSRPTRQARPCNVPSGCLAAMMRTFAPGLRSLLSPGT